MLKPIQVQSPYSQFKKFQVKNSIDQIKGQYVMNEKNSNVRINDQTWLSLEMKPNYVF